AWADGERLFIRDENSSNGTYVNSQRLSPGDTYRLRPGDTVRVGGTIFTVAAGLAARAGTGPLPVPEARPAAPVAPAQPAAPAPGPRAQPPAVPPPPPVASPAVTRIDTAAPAPRASHRTRNVLVGGCLVLVLLALCGGVGVFGATAGRPAIAT